MSYEQAVSETDTTMVGEITGILPTHEDQFARSASFSLRVLRVERGDATVGAVINVELLHHYARAGSDGSIRCPLQRGSGNESEFKLGGRYRMLMKRDGDVFELYWGDLDTLRAKGSAR